MIRIATGQYLGKVFTTEALAEQDLYARILIRKALGIDIGAMVIKVKVI